MSSALQTFRAATIQQALAQVKKAFGRDAVILGTRTLEAKLGGLMGAARVEITAAAGPPSVRPAPAARSAAVPVPKAESLPRPLFEAAQQSLQASPLGLRNWSVATEGNAPAALERSPEASRPDPLPDALQPFYERMVRNEVGAALALRLLANAARRVAPKDRNDPAALRNEIVAEIEQLLPAATEISTAAGKRSCVALVGPPGSGKTSTIAKLAAHYALREKKRVVLLSLDTYRLATHEQLQRYGEMIGVETLTAQTVAGVRALAEKTAGAELVLVDTPGVGLRDDGRFARLAALLRALRPDETHLVLPASLAGPVQERIAQRFGRLGALRLALTHLDETLGMGSVLEAAQRLHLELSYLCDGQRVPSDLRPARPREVAEGLLAPSRYALVC